MKHILAVLLATACLIAIPITGHADTDDIVGYRADPNYWRLGDYVDDVTLKGFERINTGDYEWDAFYDDFRRIPFDGVKRDTSVFLMFFENHLELLVIMIPVEEMSFRSLSNYYDDRVGDCDLITDERNIICYEDDDGDILSLYRTYDDYGEPATAVIYMSEIYLESTLPEETPSWVEDFIESI